VLMNETVGGCILQSSNPGPERRTVDGHPLPCGARRDHLVKFGRPPTVVSYRQNSTPQAMLNSRMESPVPSREPPLGTRRTAEEGEA
jgi:hypothetical protein